MTVRSRSYRPYDGPRRPGHTRFLVLARDAWAEMTRSRWLVGLIVVTLIPPAVAALIIYLHHNAAALAVLGFPGDELVPIDGEFFRNVLGFQSGLAFLIALVVGPSLVSPDLRHNVLALVLSRPVTRTGYVLGKMTVLGGLLSAVTWLPGLLLFGLQVALEGPGWAVANAWLALAITGSAGTLVIVVSLVSLAVSAWVRWKPVARGVLLGVLFISGGVGSAVNELFGTRWGTLLSFGEMMDQLWAWLFRDARAHHLPAWAVVLSLAAACAVSLVLLARKLEPYEEVRA